MLARLPGVQAKDIVRALEHAGFEFERQKGSHVTLRDPATNCSVPVIEADVAGWL
jgi:predicted RNA binding protein YcfA (HicA-like mRNA interferase family)